MKINVHISIFIYFFKVVLYFLFNYVKIVKKPKEEYPMAKCPKCGKKLHIYNWKPECPDCHVNMVYYKSNEKLLADSEAAEIEHAKSQPSIDRAKAAFFGSAKAIIRIVLSLIPIGAMFLPLWKTVNESGASVSVNVLGVYNIISKLTFGGVINNLTKGDTVSIAIVGLLLSAVLILVGVIVLFMSLGKHGVLRNRIINFLKLAGALSALAVLNQAQIGVGLIIYIVLILALIVYNEYLTKTGLPIKHTQCLIGGLPSEEYFSLVEQGVGELEIKKKMVDALTKMQQEVRNKEKQAQEEAMKKAMARK